RDETEWCRRVVHNLAHMGRFSSDRSIRDYARRIWDVEVTQTATEPQS
ncbi:MAG: glycogen/starch/alpha-glucan phosphorylase, partial [Myxococcota bacterium]